MKDKSIAARSSGPNSCWAVLAFCLIFLAGQALAQQSIKGQVLGGGHPIAH
jgi:hypothetical protein